MIGVGGLEKMPVFCGTYGDLRHQERRSAPHFAGVSGHGWSFERGEFRWL